MKNDQETKKPVINGLKWSGARKISGPRARYEERVAILCDEQGRETLVANSYIISTIEAFQHAAKLQVIEGETLEALIDRVNAISISLKCPYTFEDLQFMYDRMHGLDQNVPTRMEL